MFFLSIFLQHHISKDSILFLSDFFNVHPSTPYWNNRHYGTKITYWVNVNVEVIFAIVRAGNSRRSSSGNTGWLVMLTGSSTRGTGQRRRFRRSRDPRCSLHTSPSTWTTTSSHRFISSSHHYSCDKRVKPIAHSEARSQAVARIASLNCLTADYLVISDCC